MSSDAALVDSLPEKYVLYFGRLSPEKGLLTLLDAVERLSDVTLVLCGDGPLRKQLEERVSGAKSRVRFTGHLKKPDVDAAVRRSTAVVLPSEWPENAPFTVLEAMAAGIPVVVSNMGGLPELIRGGGGLVFEAGSSTELSARILELWENAELARELGLRGKRFVAEELTEMRHVDELERLYQKALNTG
jgi:glycosyltransferase involved in cell wall biosynthesis